MGDRTASREAADGYSKKVSSNLDPDCLNVAAEQPACWGSNKASQKVSLPDEG
jgi:hypothetical protein